MFAVSRSIVSAVDNNNNDNNGGTRNLIPREEAMARAREKEREREKETERVLYYPEDELRYETG